MTTTVTTIETLIPTIPASVLNTGECLSVINYVLPPGTAGNTFDMYAELKDSQPITRDSCYTVCSTSPHVPNGEWYFGITDGLSISWGGTALNSQACLCFINKPPSISPNANNPPICADGRGTTQFSSWVYTVSP
ncbi:hypothetical protein BDF20DRAFT_834898 [Mycotypha africana]|uniref:uncharacterized protein n=1 Tax=Mycotypha africana TaxID=64632 RepID=UPI0023019AF2|nr:uncharacterized protein BDF20DRAFT_834898 [Mycotypha africana]KAI8982264.1 hypothetical protein BDF20DRAFT_834898 [Mycotypha africana]